MQTMNTMTRVKLTVAYVLPSPKMGFVPSGRAPPSRNMPIITWMIEGA